MPISLDIEENGLLELDKEYYLKLIDEISYLESYCGSKTFGSVNVTIIELKTKAFDIISNVVDKFTGDYNNQNNIDIFNLSLKIFEFLSIKYDDELESDLGRNQQCVINKFIDILKDDNFKEYHSNIIHVLACINCFTESQVIELYALQISNKISTDLIDLFIAKDLITVEIVQNIIKSTSNPLGPETGITNNVNVYKQQLINIVKGFNSHSKLQEEVGSCVIEYIKESVDNALLNIIFISIEDKSFFKPIVEEINNNFEVITKLLEVQRSFKELATKTKDSIINKYQYIIDDTNVIITNLIKKVLETVINIDNPNPINHIELNNKSLTPIDIAKLVFNTFNKLSCIIKNGVSISDEFINNYNLYGQEINLNKHFNKLTQISILSDFLKINISFLLNNKTVPSELTESLIQNLNLVSFEQEQNNKILFNFLSLLSKKDQIPISCYEIVKDLCGKYLYAASDLSVQDVCNIVKHLINKGLSCDALMEYLICNHLGNAALSVSLLEIIEQACNKELLSDVIIEALIDFILDDQKPIEYINNNINVIKKIIHLIAKNAFEYNKLNPSIIHLLKSSLDNKDLKQDAINSLTIIAIKNPELLPLELLEFVKTTNKVGFIEQEFAAAVSNLDDALNNADSTIIQEVLHKIKCLLENGFIREVNESYKVTTLLLKKFPHLFNECFAIIKFCIECTNNIAIIDDLLDLDLISCKDICFILSNGIYSSKLQEKLENHFFNDNSILGIALSGFSSLIKMGHSINESTMEKLIQIGCADNQSIQIFKLVKANNSHLNWKSFSLIEPLFNLKNDELNKVLLDLYKAQNKQIGISLEVIDIIFNILEDKYISVLPDNFKARAQSYLKLKSNIPAKEKIEILDSITEHELLDSEIQVISDLILQKDITKSCIKVLVNANLHKKFSLDISQVIYSLRDEFADEYGALSPFLDIVEEGVQSEESKRILNILQNKFSNVYVLGSILDQIEKLSINFSELILFEVILGKANTIIEFVQFLEFINKYELTEQDLIKYLGKESLKQIVDEYELDLLEKSLQKLQEEIGIEKVLRIIKCCEALKARGFYIYNFIQILKVINIANYGLYKELLELIYEYKIRVDDKTLEGITAIDIITNDKIAEGTKQKELFSIINNKFECPIERKGEDLIKEIISLNPDITDKALGYLSILNRVHDIYVSGEESISTLSVTEIKKLALEFRAKQAQIKNDNIVDDTEKLSYVIALVQRANNLDTQSQDKQGHLYRDTQILSILMSLDTSSNSKGKLLQIATGEGKSAISASLAAILVLYGKPVDIVTSSSVLAMAGYGNSLGFFEKLAITSSVNIAATQGNKVKDCYASDIVYGDNINFQADFLSNTSRKGSMRGTREFRVCVVDEVDSMLVDGSGTMSKQSSGIPLMEYLVGIFTHSFNHFQKGIQTTTNISYEDLILFAESIINHYIEALPIPENFILFAKHQAHAWAENMVYAKFKYEIEQDYVINTNKEGIRGINPVDKSTGVTQEKTVWQNGLHQFLQLKHNLRLSSEGLTSFFITNISYFKKYDKLYGMTGTLGSEHSQSFVRDIFNLDMEFMPTFKEKQLQEFEECIYDKSEEWSEKIVQEGIRQSSDNKRAVLIVCKTIKSGQELGDRIRLRCEGTGIKVVDYLRSESNYNTAGMVFEQVAPQTIIIATNLAGRGTDFKMSAAVEIAGGLHVISTFLANNSRDEDQIKGRTARCGHSGTYQLILLDDQSSDFYQNQVKMDLSEKEKLQFKKILRNIEEKNHALEKIESKIPKLLEQDKLYEKFSAQYLKFKDFLGDDKEGLISQYVEDFGLWLATRDSNKISIDEFIESARGKFGRKEFTNPSYLLSIFGSGNSGLAAAQDYSEKAKSHSGFYNLAADYYSAKYLIEKSALAAQNQARGSDEELDPSYKAYAHESLAQGLQKLEQLSEYVTSISISVSSAESVGSTNDTVKQFAAKVGFLKNLAKHMKQSMEVIASCPQDAHIRVCGSKSITEIGINLTKSDIQEIEFLGIGGIFEFEIFKPEVKHNPFIEIFVGACAILQMATGVMITLGTFGGASTLGASIFAEGLMDAYRLASGTSAANLDDYITQKGINYACMMVQMGVSKIASKAITHAATEVAATSAIATTTSDITRNELLMQLAKTAGTQVGITIGTELIATKVASAVRQNAFEGLETRIMERIENSVYQELGSHLGLTDAHSNIEQDQLIRSEYKLAQHILHEPKNVRIVKQISYQALNTVSSHALEGSSRLTAFGTNLAVAASQSVVASTDIMPLADELAEGLRSEIARFDAATKARFAQHKQPLVADDEVRRSLSHKLGEIGARHIMNAVEGRVIAPIASVAAGKVIDLAVGDFARTQQQLLAEYQANYVAQSGARALVDAGVSVNAEEEVQGLPWLDEDDSNKTGVTKKPTHPGYKKDHRQEPAVSKPHVEKAKTMLKISAKRPTAEQKAEEERAAERVIMAIKLKEQMLGMPVTDDELMSLAVTNQRPIYITEDGKFHSVFGVTQAGKPVVVERETKGLPKTISDIGNNLFSDFMSPDKMGTSEFLNPFKMSLSAVGEIKQYIEENAIYGIMKIPGGRYALEKISEVMHPVSTVLHAGADSAAKLVLTEQEISVLKQKFTEQPNGIQILGRDILEMLLFGGTTKVVSTTFKTAATITKPLAKTGLDTLKSAGNKAATFVSEVGDSLLPPMNPAFAGFGAGFQAAEKPAIKSTVFTSEVMDKTTHTSEVKTPTASSTKIKEVTGAGKKFEIDSAIPESHLTDVVKYEANVTLTAKDVFQQNPHITKHYLNEMAELTMVGALHEAQLPMLKDILRQQEFVKLDQASQLKHRTDFGKALKKGLREEWSAQTGKEWPVYEQEYYSKVTGRSLDKLGKPYDAHHIIPVSHGGPNQWWNMHPAHFLNEHNLIHGGDSAFRELFNSKIKK